MTFAEAMQAAARAYIEDCLAQACGNATEAAKIAGIHRTSFHRLRARCGMNPAPRPVYLRFPGVSP